MRSHIVENAFNGVFNSSNRFLALHGSFYDHCRILSHHVLWLLNGKSLQCNSLTSWLSIVSHFLACVEGVACSLVDEVVEEAFLFLSSFNYMHHQCTQMSLSLLSLPIITIIIWRKYKLDDGSDKVVFWMVLILN